MIPGEYFLSHDDVSANLNRPENKILVVNVGDRPVQIGSHFHFFEVNRALRFDRSKAYGMRLNIPAGTAARFEPGEEKEVSLIGFGGNRTVIGLNGLTNGPLDDPEMRRQALERAIKNGFHIRKGKP